MHKLALSSALVVALAVPLGASAADPPDERRLLVELVEHYRGLTWSFQRAAGAPRTRTSYAERRTEKPDYLQWMVDRWRVRSHAARERALRRLSRSHGLVRPAPVGKYRPIVPRIRYFRALAWRLQQAHPGLRRSPSSASFVRRSSREYRRWVLHLWQDRSARAAIRLARLSPRRSLLAVAPARLVRAFLCIKRHEGAWTSNTGNGYYGGLQMDRAFQRRYGFDYVRRWGTADRWPPWAQVEVAVRAHRAGRGFGPWPNTRRMCGV